MARFDLLAFDADDTLWHTERLYADAQAQFRRLRALSMTWNGSTSVLSDRDAQHAGFGYGISSPFQ